MYTCTHVVRRPSILWPVRPVHRHLTGRPAGGREGAGQGDGVPFSGMELCWSPHWDGEDQGRGWRRQREGEVKRRTWQQQAEVFSQCRGQVKWKSTGRRRLRGERRFKQKQPTASTHVPTVAWKRRRSRSLPVLMRVPHKPLASHLSVTDETKRPLVWLNSEPQQQWRHGSCARSTTWAWPSQIQVTSWTTRKWFYRGRHLLFETKTITTRRCPRSDWTCRAQHFNNKQLQTPQVHVCRATGLRSSRARIHRGWRLRHKSRNSRQTTCLT